MNALRAIRQFALEMMYQLDVRSDQDAEEILQATLDRLDEISMSEPDIRKAWELARQAHRGRRASDLLVSELAPAWPAVRQPAMDRAILRLAHYEMTSGAVPPKVAVNEAVELAKKFGSEKSPAFVNGILDKVLKQVLADRGTQEKDKESV